jgi:hypothetical protein
VVTETGAKRRQGNDSKWLPEKEAVAPVPKENESRVGRATLDEVCKQTGYKP